jgi:hypothetical protein
MLGIVLFSAFTGIFLDVLVALFGSRRNIGFGWTFIISVVFTPLVGLIAVLLSNPLPQGAAPKYGCLGFTFGIMGMALMILIAIAVVLGILSIFYL